MTATPASRVLVIEDNPEHLKFVDRCVSEGLQWEMVPATTVGDGVECLTAVPEPRFEIILLDLNLPDGEGLGNLRRILNHCGTIPVVVFTAECDNNLAAQAVRDGADDYLVKQELTPGGLVRAIRNSLERRHSREEWLRDPLVDDLTGLYNRRAFLALADQQIAIARRARQSVSLLIGDLDGLSQINEAGGIDAGDQALIFTARVLRVTFRDCDLVARLRGDEYAVLMAECSRPQIDEFLERLRWRLASQGLTMTFGAARLAPSENVPLDLLMVLADEALIDERKPMHIPGDPQFYVDRRRSARDKEWRH